MFVEPHRVVAEKRGWLPFEQFLSDTTHHLIVAGQQWISDLRDGDAGDAHRSRRRHNVVKNPASYFEFIHLVQFRIRSNGGKLKNQIEIGVGPSCLGVVENRVINFSDIDPGPCS